MTAGTGVIHSEFNASETDAAHFLQIWIAPAVSDLPPGYRQIAFAPSEKQGTLRLIAGPPDAAADRALAIHQDARVYAAGLDSSERVTYELAPGRGAWLHCATGRVSVNDLELSAGDGVAVTEEAVLAIQGAERDRSDLLLFDLA
jgi:redox-sensitive bicupin YhaK (pirin superfamily)